MRIPMAWMAWVAVVVVVVVPRHSLQQSSSVRKNCPCQEELAKYLPKDKLGDDFFVEGTTTSVLCCKDILLGYDDPEATIQWSFNGKPYSDEGWSSSLSLWHCGNEMIRSSAGKPSDTGTYTCTVTSSNGTIINASMQMKMDKNIDHREEPMAPKRSPDVVAKVGANVTFTCESYVGVDESNSNAAHVYFGKYSNNGSPGFAKSLPNVTERKVFGTGGSQGIMKGELTISSVQEIHFGVYQCTMVNTYGAVSLNMTLTEGVPESEMMILRYRTTVTAVAAVFGLLVVSLLVWCRWGRLLALYCRHRLASSDSSHQYDVFLVHGNSVYRWVWSVLLPTLEDTFGYTCFLPQRDMCGGDMVAESILEAMARCRRVVVVVTPCLLDSPWATWATYSGIQSALTSRARILALVHKEKSFVSGPSEGNSLLSVLKVVRKIWVPEEIVWDSWGGVEPLHYTPAPVNQTDVHMKELEADTPKTELKLIIPDNLLSSSMSGSPRSQRLSNMITGSNTASREDLDTEKDKKPEVCRSVMFTEEDHDMQDPGSPNSVTPFIIPWNNDAGQPDADGLICQPVGRCLQMMCVGNPKEKFWQTLRLHLGPPSLSRRAGSTNV